MFYPPGTQQLPSSSSSSSSSASASDNAANIKFTSFPQHGHRQLPDCDITYHRKHQSSNDEEFPFGDKPVNDQMFFPWHRTVKPHRVPGCHKCKRHKCKRPNLTTQLITPWSSLAVCICCVLCSASVLIPSLLSCVFYLLFSFLCPVIFPLCLTCVLLKTPPQNVPPDWCPLSSTQCATKGIGWILHSGQTCKE